MIGTHDLAQLNAALHLVSTRVSKVKKLDKAFYSAVASVKFRLYRDFPDPQARHQLSTAGQRRYSISVWISALG